MKKVTASVLLLIRLGGGELTSTLKVPSLDKFAAAVAAAAILPEVVRIRHYIRIPSAFLSLL